MKVFPQNRFRASIAVFALAVSAAAPALMPAIAQTVQVPAGRYCGELASGGSTVEVETELSVAPDGHLSGKYTFRDGGAQTSGFLIEADPSNGLLKRLRWADKYGTGRLVMTFTEDYSSFAGQWGAKDAPPSELWNGRRCGESTT